MDIDNFLRDLHKTSTFIPKYVLDNGNSGGGPSSSRATTSTSRKRLGRRVDDFVIDEDDDDEQVFSLDKDEDIELIADLLDHGKDSEDRDTEDLEDIGIISSSESSSCNPKPSKRPRRVLDFEQNLELDFHNTDNMGEPIAGPSRQCLPSTSAGWRASTGNIDNFNEPIAGPSSQCVPGTSGGWRTSGSKLTTPAPNSRLQAQDIEEPEEIVVRHRQVLKVIPTVPYVPITCENGSRVYLRVFPDKDEIVVNPNPMLVRQEEPTVVRPRRGLLGVSFQELKRQADEDKSNFDSILGELTLVDIGGGGMNNNNNNNGIMNVNKTEHTLWVEKYKPRSYMDLLSEETVNHALLHWLKLWDKSVFGSDYLAKVQMTKEKHAKLIAKEKEKFDKYKRIIVEDEAYDDLGRPKQKVVLLYGPPGLGKTTAAHVICKHAGYNVIELNASDDRSVDIFKKTLDATTQSRSEMFQDGRPNCLVIDEIDGAPLPTVTVLVDLITGKSTETGKNKNKKILRRPIICICNELFSPSLKNLKKIALLIPFQPITVATLVERLEDISIKENLNLDHTTMYSLAEKTECDIRSCLACVQFMKGKTIGRQSREKMLEQLGIQDKTKGIFDTWKEIFQLPEEKKKSYYGKSTAEDPTRPRARFNNILRTAQSFGEYEKLMEGVFENYLRANIRDSYFNSIIQGLDWINWFDQIQSYIKHQQNYSVYPLLPFYFVAVHFLFAGRNWIKLQYPSNEPLHKATRLLNSTKSQIMDMHPNIGRYVDISCLTLDIFPSLVAIIQPSTIRPVPTQLWSPKERELIKLIVDTMIEYNITYTQQRSVDGNYSFLMEPDVEELSTFPLEDSSNNKKQFAYAVKQLIAREIETEKLRRNDAHGGDYNMDIETYKKISHKPSTSNKIVPNSSAKSNTVVARPNVNIESQDLTVVTERKAKPFSLSDYFGVKIIPRKVKGDEDGNKIEAEKNAKKAPPSDIYYRYKSGYTNAVRRNLKVKDLL